MQGGAAGAILPWIVLFGIMYFLMIRPQQKQAKARREMLEALKKGDRVVTVGGIHGTITALNDQTLRLKVADQVEITLNRGAVAGLAKSD